jgi:hypothetical protein
MNSAFSCLEQSINISEKIISATVMDLLNNVTFKQSDLEFVASKNIETTENQQYILNNWETLSALFHLPERLKKNQKFVSQTIKFIINFVNEKYQFAKKIEMKNTQKSIYSKDLDGNRLEKKITFTVIKL